MRKRSGAQAASKGKLASLEQVAKAFGDFRPAREVLRVVRAVPTRFVQCDHAMRVGGFPIERFALVHGPSGEGKTNCVLGIIDSFLEQGHPALYVDAERTTPIPFVRMLMGKNADHPLFFAMRPDTYEATTAAVRNFVLTVKAQRDAGRVAKGTSALVVVDSLKKLVPANIWTKIMDDVEKNGIDGVGGAAGRLKAALNAQWLDELTPLLEDTQTAMIAIAREREDPDADKWAKKAKRDYKVGGGKAIYYDSSMVIRVDRAGYYGTAGDKDGRNKVIYGQRHRVTIRKSKVAGQEEKETLCYFHTSNGALVPEGFDRARDVLELAERFDVVQKTGSWYAYNGDKIGNGRDNAVKELASSPEKLAMIESIVRSRFNDVNPLEYDPATGEVTS